MLINDDYFFVVVRAVHQSIYLFPMVKILKTVYEKTFYKLIFI